ncbi:Uncharacterised protein [Vibrio cholerae]|nr:Uncharacterised protein [Vibrio cholerae]CSB35665.1 Uncharacterised protein [Vibrio cholerae]CSC47655.1 Uncharacterised protein [Vibrio cholerae]
MVGEIDRVATSRVVGVVIAMVQIVVWIKGFEVEHRSIGSTFCSVVIHHIQNDLDAVAMQLTDGGF